MTKIFGDIRAVPAATAALLLAACAAEEASESEASGAGESAEAESTLSAESLVMAQTAWLSVSADGEVFTTFLDDDGRYRDLRGGELSFAGSWQQNDQNELCFTPDQGEGECWTHRSPGLNGVMRATNRAGRAIEVKRVAYVPVTASIEPPASEETPEASTSAESDTQSDRD